MSCLNTLVVCACCRISFHEAVYAFKVEFGYHWSRRWHMDFVSLPVPNDGDMLPLHSILTAMPFPSWNEALKRKKLWEKTMVDKPINSLSLLYNSGRILASSWAGMEKTLKRHLVLLWLESFFFHFLIVNRLFGA